MRVGIVGLGNRLSYLARIFSVTLGDDFTVVAHVDPELFGLGYTEEHHISIGKRYPTLETILESENLDLLMVGSPNHMHLGHIRTGLEAGAKIFTEKPVVTTVAETLALARLIHEYGSDNVMVGLVLRYAPLYIDLRRAPADGMLGDIVSIE